MQELAPEAFRFALENTVDGVIMTDMHSVITYVNPGYAAITGFSREELIGNKPNIIASRHTTLETYRQMWSVILGGGWWRGEIVNARKSGEEWYSYLSISQIKDASGRPFAYVGITRDITEMKRLQFGLKEASLEAIFMLSAAAEAKDEVTGSHIRRVQHYSEALARRLGFSATDAEEIGYSSMMHDVGKLHVPDVILKKAGRLTRDEWDAMFKHPFHGVVILRQKPFYARAREIAGNHHEKWDGSGYPEGKSGEEIPISARIVTVADVFDALTTSRPYKEPWDEPRALEELVKEKGRSFDPAIVDAFVSLYNEGAISRIRREFPETETI